MNAVKREGRAPRIQQTAIFSALVLMASVLFATAVVHQSAQAQTYTVLHTFHGPDGAHSAAKLARDSAGNLYGTTVGGGDINSCGGIGCGTVFKVDSRGTLTTLYIFKGGTDGAAPIAPLVRDAAGNLYGTAYFGGDLSKCIDLTLGCGVLFKIDTRGHETVLHTFTGSSTDGAAPNGLIRDAAGNLYGTSIAGGDPSCNVFPAGCGTVFKLDKNGHFRVLHAFSLSVQDGQRPWVGLVRDGAGNLYGTTTEGGASNKGTVFKVDKRGKEVVLHSFTGFPNDGEDPRADLIRDNDGNLYGTTFLGGGDGFSGTVFKVDKHGIETVLHKYKGVKKGRLPYADLIRDAAGNLYGTTAQGGTCPVNPEGCGTIFKLDKRGKLTVLYGFSNSGDGFDPQGGLIRDAAGNFYGTTFAGGDANCDSGNGCGTVFKLALH
jgi:uncharacterized repeat protein (TIGR03803 family)